MSESKNTTQQSLEGDLLSLERSLANDHDINVASYLDHTILLAAQAELKQQAVKKVYQLSWFRKLSLPLYAATSIGFALFAVSHLWQPPKIYSGSEDKTSTSVKFSQPSQTAQPKVSVKSRIERELPQLILPPSNDLMASDIESLSNSGDKSQPLLDQPEANQSIFTGNQMQVKNYSEKQAWVNKIVDYMKKGQLKLARNEMVAFKEAYPDYPIEEQIKLFLP